MYIVGIMFFFIRNTTTNMVYTRFGRTAKLIIQVVIPRPLRTIQKLKGLYNILFLYHYFFLTNATILLQNMYIQYI